MNDNLRLFFAVTTGTAAVVFTTKTYLQIRRTERANREKIEQDLQLDLTAIANAGPVIQEAIERGEIRSLAQLQQRLHDEFAFQKIAIREDN